MPARHSVLSVRNNGSPLGGAQAPQTRLGNKPRPQQKSQFIISRQKTPYSTCLLFTTDEGTDLAKDYRTKTGRDGVRRCKLTGENGRINVLDCRDLGSSSIRLFLTCLT